VPAAFARLPIPAGVRAFYVPVARTTGTKGDTVYVPTDLDISDLHARSVVIHEPAHAEEDKGAPGIVLQVTNRIEANACRAQARFLTEHMVATRRPRRHRGPAGRSAHLVETQAMLIESLSDRARFEPMLVPLGGAVQPPVSTQLLHARLNRGAAALTVELLATIDQDCRLLPGQQSVVNGLIGESALDVLRGP
jgi:hypothetical protein